MNRSKWLLQVGVILFCAVGCSTTHRAVNQSSPEPKSVRSSEIPARREFPVDASISPCDDFYAHTCSKAIDSFQMRDDRSRHYFAFDDSKERLLEAKKKYLGSLIHQIKKLSPMSNRLKNLYASCMNAGARATEEREWVSDYLSRLSKIKTREEFQRFIADQIYSGEAPWVSIGDLPSLERPERSDVVVMSDMMLLPERSYYTRPEVLKDEMQLAEGFFRAIGVSNPSYRAMSVVTFEKDFSMQFPLPVEFRDRFNEKSDIKRAELVKKFPKLKLEKAIRQLPKSTRIRHVIPESLDFLNRALDRYSLEELKSIYLFHALGTVLDDGYPLYYATLFEFRKKWLGGPVKRPDRDERCADWVIRRFGRELDFELLPILFPEFPEKKLASLVERVRSSIIEGMSENRWLSESARKAAIEKMKIARLRLVKPRNAKEWDFSPPANYSPTKFLENNRLLSRNLDRKMLKELAGPRNRVRWYMTPLTVNAYYNPSDNEFVLPIGILQYPFFDSALSDEANLGAMGAVVGHELGHGIDDKGSKYDAKGVLRAWMSQNDLSEFERRTKGLVDQFNSIGHNGKLTLGENIGDLVGLSFAYRAAALPEPLKTEEENRRAREFFYQYARVWCGVERPQYTELQRKTNPHSAPSARTNEQVKHQRAFQEAFQCRDGDPMVLPNEKRIRVW